MRPMNILDQSIQAAGGVSALAKSLDLEPNVVSNWRTRGIPIGWATALTIMQKHGDGVFASGHITNVAESESVVCAKSHVSS